MEHEECAAHIRSSLSNWHWKPLVDVIMQKCSQPGYQELYGNNRIAARVYSSNRVTRREALPRRKHPALPPSAEAWVGSQSRSGDKLQFFRTSDPKPTFKKVLLEAFPWTRPSSHPPLS